MNHDNLLHRMKRLIWDPMDPWLFYAMLTIYVMSLFLLYSADGQDIGRLESKTLHTVMGFILLWILASARPQTLANFAPPLYITGVLLLLGVHFFGITVNGSTRWLNVGFTRIQPSEIMKIALPMMVCNVLGAFLGSRLALLRGNSFVRIVFLGVVFVQHYL